MNLESKHCEWSIIQINIGVVLVTEKLSNLYLFLTECWLEVSTPEEGSATGLHHRLSWFSSVFRLLLKWFPLYSSCSCRSFMQHSRG